MKPTVSQFFGPVAATLGIHCVYMLLFLGKYGPAASAFWCAARHHAGRFPYEFVTRPLGSGGHDGQFYYALARFPWQKHGDDIDWPAARQLRILYPAFCWLCSAGGPRLLFYVMHAMADSRGFWLRVSLHPTSLPP